MPTVLDASAFVLLLLRSPSSDAVAAVIERGEAIAPTLLGVETMSALSGLQRGGVLTPDAATAAAAQARSAPIALVPDAHLLERAWSLRHNVSAYDALYVALADAQRCTLLTADARLARAMEGHIAVTLIP